MTNVMTVTGPVGAERLGRVLVHEHVLISYPGDRLDPAARLSSEEIVDTAVKRMNQLREFGVRTFVDPCPIELGRDPELLAVVSQRSGMQIVCSTGFYHEHEGIGIPYYWRSRTVDEIASFYLHEIRKGIAESGIFPGVIKIASGDPPGEHDRKVLAAAAIAARESGLPVVSHCENSVGDAVQQDILEAGGVDMTRVLIGHQDQETDVEKLRGIAARGSFVGIDRVGYTVLAPDELRADNAAALIAGGRADRLCLAQDHMCCLVSPKFPYPIPDAMRQIFEEQLMPSVLDQMHRRPHTYLFTDFLPLLSARGVDDETLERILTVNPRRLLAGE